MSPWHLDPMSDRPTDEVEAEQTIDRARNGGDHGRLTGRDRRATSGMGYLDRSSIDTGRKVEEHVDLGFNRLRVDRGTRLAMERCERHPGNPFGEWKCPRDEGITGDDRQAAEVPLVGTVEQSDDLVRDRHDDVVGTLPGR